MRVLLTSVLVLLTACKGEADPADPAEETGTPCELVELHPDSDGDGQGNAVHADEVCVGTAGWVDDDRDCDDTDPAVFEGAEELCNGVDDDCDDRVDWEDPELSTDDYGIWFKDEDGDGYGSSLVYGCTQPSGTSEVGGDCRDAVDTVNPGAPEDCDGGYDEDCDGRTNCEDGDCATADRCVEDVDECNDGYDDDGDGLIDCDDDDCWGTGFCKSIQIQLLDAFGGQSERRRAAFTNYGGGSSTGGTRVSVSMVVMEPVGRFALDSVSCQWSAESSVVQASWDNFGGASSTHFFEAERVGFGTSGACGGLTVAVLPRLQLPDLAIPTRMETTAGAAWWSGSAYTDTSWTSSGTSPFGTSGYTAWRFKTETRVFGAMLPGATWSGSFWTGP